MQGEMHRLCRRAGRCALPFAVLAVAATSTAPARAADFTCEASAIKVSLLGAKTLEPVTVNQGSDSCADKTRTLTGKTAGLPLPLSADGIFAATSLTGPADDVAKQRVLAAAGVANLGFVSLPTLPIQLPKVTLPDALKTVHVDLSPLNAVLAQTGGTVTALLGQLPPVPVAPVGGGTGGGGVGPVCVLNVCVRQVSGLLPSSVDLDVTQAVQGLLPSGQLPNLQLLGVKGATAYAGGQCV